tara:strand:+ start:1049 stop:1222 length:174 start_codon:yes stop_codon:yes gene_type:complete
MNYTYKWAKNINGGNHSDILIRTNNENTQHTMIPVNSENTDYLEYLEWAKTNTTGNE